MKNNLVSILMPVYNASKFIRETIESILCQTYTNFELLVINDGSTDNSEEIILSYKDPRIRYFKKENGGASSARNFALDQVQGSFILFQDADDLSLPNRIELLLKGFYSEKIGFVHSDMLLIDEMNKPIGYWQSKQISNRNELIRFFLKIGTPFNNASMMIRASILKAYRYDTSLKIGEDTDVVSRFAINHESVHINQPLLLYRRHSTSATREIDFDMLNKHINLFINQYSLHELFPELNWNSKDATIKAMALLGYYLVQRGMAKEGVEQFQHAYNLSNDQPNLQYFISGLLALAQKNGEEALHYFDNINEEDAVLSNYIGEGYVRISEYEKATEYFLRALSLSPNYIEPLDNLRSLGGRVGLNLVDSSWTKFH